MMAVEKMDPCHVLEQHGFFRLTFNGSLPIVLRRDKSGHLYLALIRTFYIIYVMRNWIRSARSKCPPEVDFDTVLPESTFCTPSQFFVTTVAWGGLSR